MINVKNIPNAIKERDQWVLWREELDAKGKLTKRPYSLSGVLAKPNDATTWSSFADAMATLTEAYSGIGYMFAKEDEFCGVDLDGCRNPETGEIAMWAKDAILKLDTYAEVSPSRCGVKLFAIGKNPFDSGKKKILTTAPRVYGNKSPAVEIYDDVRYFTVTGWNLRGHAEPQPRQDALNWIKDTFWKPEPPPPKKESRQTDFHTDASVIDRARKYITRLPQAISGNSGHNAAFRAACVLILGFGLSIDDAMRLMREWNERCDPPWSEKELLHKVTQADKKTDERNYLRNAHPTRWDRMPVPEYDEAEQPEKPKSKAKVTTLVDAAKQYVAAVREGKMMLEQLGIDDVDTAIGGGIQQGEVIVVAARPGHGKSAAALQIIHHWTATGKPCVIVSEEMSSIVLGKRSLQYFSEVPVEHWRTSLASLDKSIEDYATDRAQCVIVESCGTAAAAVEQIEKAVDDHHVKLAVVDYAQLLRSPGGTRYEQITATSELLTKAAKRLGITMVMLCQLNRAIESRAKFQPQMSDLKDSGQFEQDADVILFLVWPHKIDPKQPANEFRVYVAKNRHRETVMPIVKCRFMPGRQAILPDSISDRAKKMNGYEHSFDDFNES